MGLGGKLFEEKGRVTWQAIKPIQSRLKPVGTEGESSESKFAGDIKGFGRLKGIDGSYEATSVTTQKAAIVRGSFQGVLTTTGGQTVTIRGFGTGKVDKDRFRGANLVVFDTDSRKLSWMNSLIAFWEVTAKTKSLEFTGIAYRWK